MRPPRLLLPLGLLVLLLALVAPAAMAGPATALAPLPSSLLPGHVHIGIGIGVVQPLPPPPPPRVRTVVVRPPPRGHYETRIQRSWVEGELVGYDLYGYPVYAPGYWVEREIRVWVPHRRPRIRRGHIRRGRILRGRLLIGV